MRIAVIGTGYVGLVSGACFSDVGHSVVCVDVDEDKVALLSSGGSPIHEPGLEPMLRRNLAAGRLAFTSCCDTALADADIIFIAVGTPAGADGRADLADVMSVARSIGQGLRRPAVIVSKSTVPVGTTDKLREVIAGEIARRGAAIDFSIVSNPEFLKEGAALNDFMKPDRIVVGATDPAAIEVMRQLYAPFSRNHEKLVEMDIRSAELTKYAANAMLATRISFMNELARLSEALDADIEAVRLGMGMDARIGTGFLYAGAGYGGSCFPKDVKALLHMAAERDRHLKILSATERVNDEQKELLYAKLMRFFGGSANLVGKTIGLWGLAFKPDTDDMREAPSLALIRRLFAAGARVRAYDPVAAPQARAALLAEHGAPRCSQLLELTGSAMDSVTGADALVVVTEWKEFRAPDFGVLRDRLRHKVLFDGRNIYDPGMVRRAGLRYVGIGRHDGHLS